MNRPGSFRDATTKLRVIVADDERPARRFLVNLLMSAPDVVVVGEAADGAEAVTLIERERPDLALLDLEMPEADGLGVVRLLRKDSIPLVAFVTAYDAYAIQAFELNAIDYLLKPVDGARLRETLMRAHDRLERSDLRESDALRLTETAALLSPVTSSAPLERIPVRRRDDVILVPVSSIIAIIADGELLHLTTRSGERHTITYRLKDLEVRVPQGHFIRLSRGALARVESITKVSPMPGGTYLVELANGQQLPVSRLRSRVVRDSLLRL